MLSSAVQARGRRSPQQAWTTVARGASLALQGLDTWRRVLRVLAPPGPGGVHYEQPRENVRRKGVLPRRNHDRSIC